MSGFLAVLGYIAIGTLVTVLVSWYELDMDKCVITGALWPLTIALFLLVYVAIYMKRRRIARRMAEGKKS